MVSEALDPTTWSWCWQVSVADLTFGLVIGLAVGFVIGLLVRLS